MQNRVIQKVSGQMDTVKSLALSSRRGSGSWGWEEEALLEKWINQPQRWRYMGKRGEVRTSKSESGIGMIGVIEVSSCVR